MIENKRVSIAEFLVYGTDKIKLIETTPDDDKQESVTTPDNNKQESVTTPDDNKQESVTTPDNNKQEPVTTPDDSLQGIVDDNQETIGNLGNNYGDNMTNDEINENLDNQDLSVNTDGDKEQKPPKLPKYEIPEFYNYVWLIFCGALVVLIGAFWSVILLMIKKRRKEKN